MKRLDGYEIVEYIEEELAECEIFLHKEDAEARLNELRKNTDEEIEYEIYPVVIWG